MTTISEFQSLLHKYLQYAKDDYAIIDTFTEIIAITKAGRLTEKTKKRRVNTLLNNKIELYKFANRLIE